VAASPLELRKSVRAAGLFCKFLMSINIPHRSVKNKTVRETEPSYRTISPVSKRTTGVTKRHCRRAVSSSGGCCRPTEVERAQWR
jgi:hypothetical protein